MRALRLVTLNTWKCDGAYARRLELMTEGLATLKPDVVALQEVFAAPGLGADTAVVLADALSMRSAVLPLRRKRRTIDGVDTDSSSGLAVLSRLPILAQRAVPLTSDPRDGERAALVTELEMGSDRVTVASLHLTHLADSAALRRRQWREIAAAVSHCPTALLAGDFNAPIEVLGLERTRFRDCRTVCGEAPRPTLIGGDASQCIDHVLFTRQGVLVPVHWSVAMAGSSDEPGLTASDHGAVVVDLSRS